ncbi:isoaspartyl peptidase/L-asparaginase family protein [Limnovirga soli]|uniref:Isoaspartyl peptidase n=1 Tax=Limnovirga soli TaxID=2656915 RepID=A0A8J8JZ31_9BACT|nr:isoaspartyl peptidase/L-asparaginase [Limnovirga soli]NNV57921.1 beta-aspartyl-peptidase [Limnovirga soli]
MQKFSLVIHGGAGTILQQDITAEQENAYKQALQYALNIGYAILQNGGTAVDAVHAAVTALEDNILFNAGCGSVFTKKGGHEMDASIMEGKQLMAGAVSGISNVRNPITLAKAVMEKSDHVFLSGDGANEFAVSQGILMEPDAYFFSQFRFNQWKDMQHSNNYALDHSKPDAPLHEKKFGTVGAAACDAQGNIAAATSTGGMTNKQFGRVGDSPIIGSGTYANNQTCAISCTGHGELFIRAVAAYDVSCLMEYKNLSLQDAMHTVVMEKLVKIGGEGGMIGVDAKGNTAMIFNSEGMYRGTKNSEGENQIAIYK